MVWTYWIGLSAIFSFLGVGMGAFGAHALKSTLTIQELQTFEVAVRYQMYHALALFGVGLLNLRIEMPSIKYTGVLFTVGIFIFSGSLFALVLTKQRWLGALTPIGGACFLVGWLSLFYTVLKIREGNG